MDAAPRKHVLCVANGDRPFRHELFNERTATSNGLYGIGAYFAFEACKALHYARITLGLMHLWCTGRHVDPVFVRQLGMQAVKQFYAGITWISSRRCANKRVVSELAAYEGST